MGKKRKKRKNIKSAPQNESPDVSLHQPIWNKHPMLFSIAIVLLLLIIFYYPVLFQGKTLFHSDSQSAICYRPFIKNALEEGNYPLWNPYVFAGMPSFASLSGAPYVNLTSVILINTLKLVTFFQVDPNDSFLRLLPLYFLFGIFTFLLFRHFKFSNPVSFCLTIAMVFMPEVIGFTASGHNTKMGCVMYLPLIFLLTDKLLNSKNLLYFSLLGLAIGLQFLWKHVQMIYLTLMLIGIYFIFWSIQTFREKKTFKPVLANGSLFFGAILLGALISSVVYLSVWEYSHYSIRGGGFSGGLDYDYATAWSFPPAEILTFFVPSFMGFGDSTYWGQMTFTHFPMYFGVIVLMLAGLSLIVNRNRMTWFFLIFGLMMLFLSFGKHLPILFGPFFKLIPLFNKFRAPKIMLIMFNFSMVILAGFGLQGLFSLDDNKRKQVVRYLQIFCGISLLLLIILMVGKGAYMNWANKIGRGANAAYSMAQTDSLRSFFFVITAAVIVYLSVQQKIKLATASLILAGLIFFDLQIIDKKIVDPKPKREIGSYFNKTSEIKYLKSLPTPFRILPFELNNPPSRTANWYMYHGIENVDGYTAAKMKIFQDMLDAYQLPTSHIARRFVQKYIKQTSQGVVFRDVSEVPKRDALADRAFFKLFNIQYILSPYQFPDTTLKMVYPPQTRGGFGVFEFTENPGRAYFPKSVRKVIGKEPILRYITSGAYDPVKMAILEEDPPFETEYSDSNRVAVTGHGIHHLELETNVKTPSCLVVSEMYYPAGWKAYVDGKETKIYKTNYVNRGLFLKPGNHTIRFEFKPRMFYIGLWISVIVLVFLISGVVAGMLLEKRRKNLIQPVERIDRMN